jgi:hypothetical protein
MWSEISIAASKHVTKQEVNGVQCLETRPRDHTFTSGHMLPVDGARKEAAGVWLMWEQTVLVRGE